MGANLTLSVAGLNKIQTGRRCIASVGGKLSSLVVASIIRVQNLQISAGVSVRDLKICVILHRELRIECRTCRYQQHPVFAVHRYGENRRFFCICFDPNRTQFFYFIISALQSGKLHACLCFRGDFLNALRRLCSGQKQRFHGCDIRRNPTVGDIQFLILVIKIQFHRGDADCFFPAVTFSVIIFRRLILRLAFFQRNRLHGYRIIAFPGKLSFRFRYDRRSSLHRHCHGNIFILIMERLIQLHRSFRRISLRLRHQYFVVSGNYHFIDGIPFASIFL